MPFIGNLNNQGLTNASIISSSIAYSDSGKIGKCLSAGSLSTSKNHLGYEGTIAFWIYINPEGTCNTLYGNNSISSGTDNRKWSLFLYSSDTTNYPHRNSLHSWGCMKDNSMGTNGDFVLNGVIPDNTWTHVCVAHDRSNQYIYINGALKSTVAWNSSGTFTFDVRTNLISGLSGHKINDYRIYDHCLSPFEVKQISQGLVCHYKLSNHYEIGQKNKYSGSIAEGSLSGSFTKTKLSDERGYNYKLTYTGNGNNSWLSMDTGSTFSFTIGKKYYYSCKVRCHSANFGFSLRAARSSNDWVTSMTNVLAKKDGEWHEYYVSQTINETYNRSGSTVTCNPILEFYSDNLSTADKVYSADFDIKDIQVIESDCYMPFIDNSMASNMVYDCSGYGNNGTIQGNITWSSNTPKYSGSYRFDGTNYIKTNYSASMSELSCSFWVKPSSQNGGYSIIASNYNNPPSGFWIAVNCENSGLWFYNGAYVTGNSLLSNDVWYHGVFTYNKGIGKWYLNGELVTTADISSKGTSLTISSLSIGNSYTGTAWNTKFYGSISDFRIYATCLSDEDVKGLYQVSASVDKSGILSCYEFSDNGNNEITKNGIISFSDLYESDDISSVGIGKDIIQANKFIEL